VISSALLALVRCPDCRRPLDDTLGELACPSCGRHYEKSGRDYLDLRPTASFEETTKYLDELVHTDGRYRTVSPPLLMAGIRNDMLRSFLPIGPGDRVIDLGCGSGRMLVWNHGPNVHLVGVDVSPYFAAEAGERIDLIVGDLRRLPLDDGAFTKAYSLDVLEHLSRGDLERMLCEANRVLAPGGRFFVYSHVRKNSTLALGLRAINALARGLERIGLLDLSHDRLRKSDHRNPLVDIDDLHRVTATAGFQISRIRYYTPLVGGFVENILMRIAEQLMARRAMRRSTTDGDSSEGPSSGPGARRTVRADAKRWIADRGVVYAGLRGLTWLMKLDIALFGRIKSGPFFALLVKDGSGGSSGSSGVSRASRARETDLMS